MCDGRGVGQHPFGDPPDRPARTDWLVGKTIVGGKYEIVRVLGKGGMGTVYEARQPSMQRMVAIKVIRPELVSRSDAVARFETEVKVTARVEHPNTVRLYDVGHDRGRLYLAMELLAGPTLRTVLERTGRLDVVRLIRVARQVAHALGAIHAHGIVHRDLKPDNVILLDSFGERDFVKVLDFGIAKVLDEQLRLTATGKRIGTPTYMAPEQAMGLAVDPRTDLYALGVMLYQMAGGRVPFDAAQTENMWRAHAHEPPAPIQTLAPDLPPMLAALIMQLLAKAPAARPSSAAEVATRLDACLAAHAQPPRRRWWPMLLAAALALAAAVTGYLALR